MPKSPFRSVDACSVRHNVEICPDIHYNHRVYGYHARRNPDPLLLRKRFAVLAMFIPFGVLLQIPSDTGEVTLYPALVDSILESELSPYKGYLKFKGLELQWLNSRVVIRHGKREPITTHLDWSLWAMLQRIKERAIRSGLAYTPDRSFRITVYRRKRFLPKLILRRLLHLLEIASILNNTQYQKAGYPWLYLQGFAELTRTYVCKCQSNHPNPFGRVGDCLGLLGATVVMNKFYH